MNNQAVPYNDHARVAAISVASQELAASVSRKVIDPCVRLPTQLPSVRSIAAECGAAIAEHAGAAPGRTGDAPKHTIAIGDLTRDGAELAQCAARQKKKDTARWREEDTQKCTRVDKRRRRRERRECKRSQ